MKNDHKISIIALIYSIIAVLTVYLLVIFNVLKDANLPTWVILGSAVSLFNYSILISIKKTNNSPVKMFQSLVIRWVMLIIVIVFVAFFTRRENGEFDVLSLLMLSFGLIASKVAVFAFYLLPFKKEENNDSEVINDEPHDV